MTGTAGAGLKILVTGGAGFIGSHVAEALSQAGHRVAVLDNLSRGKRENLSPSIPLHHMDLRDPGLEQLLADERYDVVSHHAAQIDVRLSVADPLADADVNVMGSLRLLAACVRWGVRKVIYASSGGAIYGEPRYLPTDEDHPIEPVSPYGVSKYAVELYLRQFAATHGLRYTVLRYPNVYGPRQDPLGEGGVVAIFARRMLAHETVYIYGSGEQERDFVYVGDCAQANLMALSAGDGRAYNLGTGTGVSVNSLFRIMAALTGYEQDPVYRPARPGETMRMAVDATRAERELGWRPKVALEEGIRRTIAAVAQGRES
ncbi:MAG: NAD-dependent epimerase/dehydratase family protein [Anaerolineae bacterium]|nr:NAD-dependent epimerase/dehydratase family protein [Anaerolineae bacterium]